MIVYLYILKSLFSQVWFLPLLVLLTWSIGSVQRPVACLSNEGITWRVWLAALATYIILAAPFWFFGPDAPHSGSDDTAITLQTYLSASRQGDAINWTNSMLGGMDRWLLPNCHPLSLGRIYALFLAPHQLYLLVIGINVILVFVFAWRLQVEFLQIRCWMAYIGAWAAVLTEGYWAGIYPNAHVSNGHGFAVIIVGIYWLTRFHERSQFWIIAMIVGLGLALGSWIPFHNLPPLLVTVTLWGLIFWGKQSWRKVLVANGLIVLVFIVVLYPQFLAMKLLYSTTGRSGIYRPTVGINAHDLISQIMSFIAAGLIVFFLRIHRATIVLRVAMMSLSFWAMPLVAYFFQMLKIMPAFRWELLFAGNETWLWLGVVFFTDKIQQALEQRWRIVGIFAGLLAISLWGTLLVFTWMGSLWFDLDSSYPSGTWRALTDTSTSAFVNSLDPEPMRVVGVGDTNDMHFWGQYQGLESILGYTPFIDSRKLYFWWFCAMMPGFGGHVSSTGIISIPIPFKDSHERFDFPILLPRLIDVNALKLSNVHWIVSRNPIYPMPDLQPILEDQGQTPACRQRVFVPSSFDFQAIDAYWRYIACVVKDYRYQRPLYLYHVQGSLPRVYFADNLLGWPIGQMPVLNSEQLAQATQRSAFVDPQILSRISSYQKSSSTEDILSMDAYHPDDMRLHIATRENRVLVINATLNQYWRIWVDKKRVHFFDVNGFQTGFWVHPHDQQVRLLYCPPEHFSQSSYCSNLSLGE